MKENQHDTNTDVQTVCQFFEYMVRMCNSEVSVGNTRDTNVNRT